MFCQQHNAEITDQKTYFKTKPNFSKTKCSETRARQLYLKQSEADLDDVVLLVINYDKVKIVQQFNKNMKFKVLCVRARVPGKNTKSHSSENKNQVGLGFLIFFVLFAALTGISCAFKPMKVSFNSYLKKIYLSI